MLKDDEAPIERKISWPRIALRIGIGAGIVAILGFAIAAVYEFRVMPQGSDSEPVVATPSAAPKSRPPTDQDDVAKLSDGVSMFGDNPWYKGIMDHPDSCALLPSHITPKDDAVNEGGDAYVERTDSRGKDYALTYTDGRRSWVYASSASECRRVTDRSLWSRAVDAATK